MPISRDGTEYDAPIDVKECFGTEIHRLTCGEGAWGPCSPYSECEGRVKCVRSCGIEPPEPGLMGHDGVLAPFETALGPRWTWRTRATVLSRL